LRLQTTRCRCWPSRCQRDTVMCINHELIKFINFVLSLFTSHCALVCQAVRAYKRLVVGRRLCDIFSRFGKFWQELAHEPQLRWVSCCIKARTERRNWTELTRFSFWRTDQWIIRTSSLDIGWRVVYRRTYDVRSPIDISRAPLDGAYCNALLLAHWLVLISSKTKPYQFSSIQFSSITSLCTGL